MHMEAYMSTYEIAQQTCFTMDIGVLVWKGIETLTAHWTNNLLQAIGPSGDLLQATGP